MRLHCQPLVSLLCLLLAVILALDCPPLRLFPVSVVPAAVSTLLFRHQGFPVTNHCIHHHIQNGGLQWVALGDPLLSV